MENTSHCNKFNIQLHAACTIFQQQIYLFLYNILTLNPMVFQMHVDLCIYYNLNKQILYIECKYTIIIHCIELISVDCSHSLPGINKQNDINKIRLIEISVSLPRIRIKIYFSDAISTRKFLILVSRRGDLTSAVNAYERFLFIGFSTLYRCKCHGKMKFNCGRWTRMTPPRTIKLF